MTILRADEMAKQIIESALVRKIYEPFLGLVIANVGRPTGAIIFNNYEGSDVHFTCVLRSHISMRDARYVARYVFGQMGCKRCTAVTSELNIAAQRALRQLGFKFEGRMRDHFNEADGLIFGILRSEQKIARL